MPYRPAMKLKVTAHMFVASQSPDAFRAASEVLDKVRAAINDLGFEEVEVSGTVGQLRKPKGEMPAAAPAPAAAIGEKLDEQIGDAVQQASAAGMAKKLAR